MRQDDVLLAAEEGRHAGLGDGGGLGHGQAALPYETERLVLGQHAGQGGRGELADAVSGGGADQPGEVLGGRKELAGGDQEAATSSGWATAVSRISSASAFVP